MNNFNGILDKVLSSSATTGLASGLAGGMAGSFLMSKKGRKFGKNALKVGGVAAVGALAYTAYKKYSNKQSNGVAYQANEQNSELLPVPTNSNFIPPSNDKEALENLEITLVKAMIAASRADGQMDVSESQAIFKQIKSFNLSQDEESLLMHQMSQPIDMDELANRATSVEIASEIYAISVLTIDEINEEERNYLSMLSMRLGLPYELAHQIEHEISNQTYSNVLN